MLAVVVDLPFDARRAQADRLVRAQDLETVVGHGLELHGQLPELRARREGDLDGDLAGDLAHQDGGVEIAAAAQRRVEPVGDRQARPARLDGHRPGDVALAQRDARADRLDGEVPGVLAAEQVGEDRRGVGAGVAHPRQARVRGEQRVVGAVGQHRVALDELRRFALEPAAAGVHEVRQEPRDVLGVTDPEGGPGGAGPHPDADVRAMEMRKRILIGHVVTEEEHRGGPQLVAQLVEGVALVGGHHRQVDDGLALRGLHAIPSGRALADLLGGLGGVGLRGLPGVQRRARRLRLHPRARVALRNRREFRHKLVAAALVLARQRPGEPDVELGAVRAHQMDLGRQARERRQVPQCATGDDRHLRLRQVRERPQRRDRFGNRLGLRGVGDDGGERAVVVAGDQQLRYSGELSEGRAKLVGGTQSFRAGSLWAWCGHLGVSPTPVSCGIRLVPTCLPPLQRRVGCPDCTLRCAPEHLAL